MLSNSHKAADGLGRINERRDVATSGAKPSVGKLEPDKLVGKRAGRFELAKFGQGCNGLTGHAWAAPKAHGAKASGRMTLLVGLEHGRITHQPTYGTPHAVPSRLPRQAAGDTLDAAVQRVR